MSQHRLPQVDSSCELFHGFFKIRCDSLTMPGGAQYDHLVVVTHDTAVVVLAQTENSQWLLVEEYRHPTGQFILGLPGGYLDGNEDPVAGAQRELREETGYESTDWQLLGSAYPYAGISGQKTYFVWAKNAYQAVEPSPEPTELMHSVLKSTAEIHELIAQGHPLDANLLTALYLQQTAD